MSYASTVESGTLDWVKTEIDQTLDHARQALAGFSVTSHDKTPLRLYASHLHQVVGTLQMVELDGAAMLAREAELLADSLIKSDQDSGADRAVSLLVTNLENLSTYLERLQQGLSDVPVHNLAIMNELREVRGEPSIELFSIFDPDLEVYPTRSSQQKKIDEVCYQEKLTWIRRRFQISLLSWLTKSETEALNTITGLIQELQGLSRFNSVAQLWWVASAYLEMMALNPSDENIVNKHVAARLDQLLRKLIEDGEAVLVRNRGEDLIREMLYAIGCSSCNSTLLTEIRRAFSLDEMLRSEANSEDQLFATVPRTLGRDLESTIRAAKERVASYFDAGACDSEKIEMINSDLSQIIDQMRQHGLNDLAGLMKEAASIMNLSAGGKLGADGQQAASLQIAEALLFLEETLKRRKQLDREWLGRVSEIIERLRSLEKFDARGGDSGQLSIARTTEPEIKTLLPTVAAEIHVNLHEAEIALEAYARQPEQVDILLGIPDKLAQVRGALRMLSQRKAADMMSTTQDCLGKLRRNEIAPSQTLINSLAVAIGTAQTFVEGLENDRPYVHEMVDRAVQDLDDALAEGESIDFDPVDTVTALREHLDSWLTDSANYSAFRQLRQRLREVSAVASVRNLPKLRRIAQEMNNLLDIVTEDPTFLSAEIESTLKRSLTALEDLIGVMPGFESLPAIQATPDAAKQAVTDPEILEIFREEARECTATIGGLLEQWHHDSPGEQLLTEVRRQFHTLKGSGRTANAGPVAELSWIVENLLNQVLEGSVEAGDVMPELVSDATETVSRAIESQDFGVDIIDLPPWEERAAVILRKAAEPHRQEVAPETTDGRAGTPDEVITEADVNGFAASLKPALDDTVVRIFTQETLGHLGTIRNFLSGDSMTVSSELLRAVHTLRGTSRSLHLVEMSNVFRSLDEHLNEIQSSEEKLGREEFEFLDKATILSAQVLDRLNTDRTFPAVLREGFDKLQDSVVRCLNSGGTESLRGEIQAIEQIDAFGKLMSGDKPIAIRPPVAAADATDAEDFTDLRNVFFDEFTDVLARINIALDEWRDGLEKAKSVANIKRDLHTLKGSAYAAGFDVIGDLSHATETLLESQETGPSMQGSELRGLLEEAHDTLSDMAHQIVRGATPPEPAHLQTRLYELSKDSPGERKVAVPDRHMETTEATGSGKDHELHAHPANPELGIAREEGALEPGRDVLRMNTGMLDKLVNYAGELSITRAQMQEQLNGLRSNLADLRNNVARFTGQLRQLELQADSQIRSRLHEPMQERENDGSWRAEFDPLQMDRYTKLQHLSRGLSESLDDLVTIQADIGQFMHQGETVLQQQAKLSFELQHGLMSTRLVPFSTLLPKLRHQARQTARELNKEVELRMTGGEVEIDRKVLDGISEALDHIIRNALDHGIEDPASREKLGKPKSGTILIECRQKGNEAVIRFSDDGAGLSVEMIRSKAIAQGLIKENTSLADQDLIQLIVLPGFTTTTEVTQLSGRGVGMDVVHNAVRRLGGSISADSEPGNGTVFEICLPLSLSITQAIFVRCGQQEFAIALNVVQNVTKADAEKLNTPARGGQAMFEKDGKIYPLIDLPRRLGLVSGNIDEPRVAILIVRMGAREIAVKVSELLGTQEVVVKTLGAHISRVDGLAGATIRGDGSVIIILDLAALWVADEGQVLAEAATLEQTQKPPLVMVVDDSLTVRKVTARNLSRHGMEVMMAKDGVDAIEQMAGRLPDLMLVDIEMPRMDGYQLTEYVRGDPAKRNIPIVIITSRAGIKHKEKAMALGANGYLTKPYQEEELIAGVEDCLQSVQLGVAGA